MCHVQVVVTSYSRNAVKKLLHLKLHCSDYCRINRSLAALLFISL